MRYFTVTAKCGHVGKGCYIPITFAVKASSAAEAASVTRSLPRVKHHHKDAILSVQEVDQDDYEDRYYINSFDPYLQYSSSDSRVFTTRLRWGVLYFFRMVMEHLKLRQLLVFFQFLLH